MARGWLITFEGGEGTGKSTQIERLCQHLEAAGRSTLVTREPGGTAIAEAVRAVLLDPAYAPDGLSELFLLGAARRDHVEKVIRPALMAGSVVLCDRFTDSSVVYQGIVRGVGEEVVDEVNALATGGLVPDLTLVLDMEPGPALRRARSRNLSGNEQQVRFDNEAESFHEKVREGFLRLARRRPERVRVVDACGELDEVFDRLLSALPAELR